MEAIRILTLAMHHKISKKITKRQNSIARTTYSRSTNSTKTVLTPRLQEQSKKREVTVCGHLLRPAWKRKVKPRLLSPSS